MESSRVNPPRRTSRRLQVALRLFWLLPLVFGLKMMLVWSRLPEVMAFRFGLAGEPKGDLPRLAALAAGLLAFSVGALVTTTARRGVESALAGGLVVFTFVGFWQMINFNLGRGTVDLLPAVTLGVLVALAIVGFGRWRLP
jgi:hypothetical protein